MTSYVEEAPMGVQITWDTVDWQYVSRHVNKLQVRIAKAVKEEEGSGQPRGWLKVT